MSRDAATKTLEFMNIIEKKNGKALKWDLYKIAGNQAAFTRWVKNYLQKEKLIEEVKKGKRVFFKKTERGEILHQTLKYDRKLFVAFKRISEKRLKSVTQVSR